MTPPTKNIATQIFRRADGRPPTNDLHSLNILMAIDGMRSVETIAKQENYELEDLTRVIEQLVKAGAIEPIDSIEAAAVGDGTRSVGTDFFSNLEAQLGQIMGPVSRLIIDEQVDELGIDTTNYPMSKARELIAQVSQSIPDPNEAEMFVRSMTELLDS